MRNELQEAIEYFETYSKEYKPVSNSVPKYILDDLNEQTQLYRTALTALREKQQRQPDPETGLVPCGCGGRAKVLKSNLMIIDYEVCCTECAMTTVTPVRGKQENAMNVWNTAMGWKGGAEG